MKSAKPANLRLAAAVAMALGASISAQALAEPQKVTVKGKVVTYTAPAAERQPNLSAIGEAKAMQLPTVDARPVDKMEEVFRQQSAAQPGPPQFFPGGTGNGLETPVKLPPESNASTSEDGGIGSQEYGTSNHVFTTARVDTASNNVSRTFPYSSAGKLYFRDGSASYVCSASLIKRGVVVTAAHCVASFGNKRLYTNFQYVPARFQSTAPYGTWNGEAWSVLSSYYNGTETCYQRGVVCPNDIAVIRLAPQGGAFPGTQTGWFGYGVNGFGFNPSNLALINQLGYPGTHDGGLIMQRTDSEGFISASMSGNTVWGSRQTEGSSGGPELVNLGVRGAISGTTIGSEADSNIVVGVTSWGYTNPAVKQQGASPFTSTNIVALVNAICGGATPTQAACR